MPIHCEDPPPPPVMATFDIFVMRPHLSTVICATSFAFPYVPGRTDPEQQPPFDMESDIYYSARNKKHGNDGNCVSIVLKNTALRVPRPNNPSPKDLCATA